MPKSDQEGQIFLSHPHTKNDFFSCSPLYTSILLEKYEKSFQKILNTLRCDMVTSFYITRTSHTDVWQACCRRATVCFYLTYRLVRASEINRIHHWCSVGTEKSLPEGPPFQWETRLAEFPTEQWTRGLGFSGTTEHQ